MEENKDIKEAKEELDKISRDDVLRRMALKKQLEEMDRKQFAYDAEQRGLKQGKELGKELGKEEKTAEVIKKLHKINMPIEQIAEIVELEEKEVKKILEKEANEK